VSRARSRARARSDDDEVELLSQAAEHIERSIRDIRELARGLHPPLLEARGLCAALDSLAEASTLPTEVRGRLSDRLPLAAETAAFFVASECLTNAVKHADATHVVITVDAADDDLVLSVADDGRGGAAVGVGSGLRGLLDRIQALDGTLDVRSERDRGTTITARIPSRG
jgi:signal transduction histidine kinase